MNRFFTFATAVLLSATIASAQSATQSEQVCRIGMQYQISYNEHWGANRPVIITVDPGSAADAAGLKPGDVIEKVAGKSTASLDETDFQRLLTEGKTTQIEVSNLGGTKTITLGRDCQSRYILSERQLARSFSFYSLEDASERRIVRPYKVKTTKADFTNLRTYSFAASTAETAEIDDVVYKEVGRYLNALGMKETVTNPDVIVDTYYLFDNNKLFTTFKSSVPQSSWQYSPREKKMVSLPIMPAGTQEINAPYVIQLGVRLINAKNNLQIFWQCESNDFLSA
ncbi:PDZ domain-containing protein, partial [Porphyromonas loveana]